METYPGFPEPPNVHLLSPMQLGFPQMRQGADFAFFNFHCSRKQTGRTLKWTVAKLEFYVKSLGLNLAFHQMVRECAEKHVDLESAVALEQFREEVLYIPHHGNVLTLGLLRTWKLLFIVFFEVLFLIMLKYVLLP
jgi:hypothetical protein